MRRDGWTEGNSGADTVGLEGPSGASKWEIEKLFTFDWFWGEVEVDLGKVVVGELKETFKDEECGTNVKDTCKYPGKGW